MCLARSAVSVFFIGAVWMEAAPATAAPQQLLDKTVTLSWSAQAVVRDPDGKERQVRNSIKYIIYISSLGRLFEHSSRSLGARTQGGDVDPNAAKTKIGEARGCGLRATGLSPTAVMGAAAVRARCAPSRLSIAATPAAPLPLWLAKRTAESSSARG
jgi:hypothetical protein